MNIIQGRKTHTHKHNENYKQNNKNILIDLISK